MTYKAWDEPEPERGDHKTNETMQTPTGETNTPRVFLFKPEAPSVGDTSDLDHRFGKSKGDLVVSSRQRQ
jgi:hypothetical protein